MAPQSLNFSEHLTLREAYANFQGDPPLSIPCLVWLLENSDSLLTLPGKIYLKEHDYLHIILDCDRSPIGEAFIIGFTMGNVSATNWFHLAIFKFVSHFFYPKKYRFKKEDFKYFDLGFTYGKKLGVERINQMLMDKWLDDSLAKIRDSLKLIYRGANYLVTRNV